MEGDRERVAQALVLEEGVFVVLQADPAGGSEEVVVGEREIERCDRRPERQAEEADQPRREEEISGAVAAPGALNALPEARRRCKAPPVECEVAEGR